MDTRALFLACALAGAGCATGDGQGADDWGDIGQRPSGSTTPQAIPSGGEGDAAVSPPADAAPDGHATVVDAAIVADVARTPDLPLPVDLAPPPDLAPVVDTRDAEIDTAPPERCPRADFLAAQARTDKLLGADFASAAAIDGWTDDFGATQAWDSHDAAGASGSGSLAVSNGNVIAGKLGTSLAGARRCVAVSGGASHDFWVRQMVAAGQPGGSGGVAVQYFAADCTGAALASESVALAAGSDAWALQCGTSTAPADAHAMAVRLVVAKTLEDPPLTVLFDDLVIAPARK